MINLFLQVTLVCVAPAYLDSILLREIKSQPNSSSAHSRQEFRKELILIIGGHILPAYLVQLIQKQFNLLGKTQLWAE